MCQVLNFCLDDDDGVRTERERNQRLRWSTSAGAAFRGDNWSPSATWRDGEGGEREGIQLK